MFKKILKFCLITSFFGFIAACSSTQFYHEYLMTGQVVSVEGSEVVICIGSDAGAEPGMVLDVYTVVNIGEAIAGDGVDNYRRETAGEIKIDTIIDEHFARGSIINGNIQQHDIAELHR